VSDGGPIDLGAMGDLRTPWCLRIAVSCRVAESLEQGTTAIADLAKAAACDRDALHAVLRHLVSRGVFEEPEPGVFAMNDSARGLTDAHTRSALDLSPFSYRVATAWATLPGYVRTGRTAYAELFGRPFWEDVSRDPQLGASFDAAMSHHHDRGADLTISGGWAAIESVADVGGGTGALLAGLLRAQPHLRGVLIDLEGPIARSREVFARAGVADRVSTVARSFFDPLPAGHDVYLLSGVVHDWDDDNVVKILARCAEAARPNGRVVVADPFPTTAAPVRIDVSMILVGGRHRTLDEFEALADKAGLHIVATESLTECRPR
jgi:2,7-dihydroxy-5-methyl-1-naphthoate 7-O-methyltransferase